MAHRRKVRIVQPRGSSPAAQLGLALMVGAILSLPFVWRWVRADGAIVAHQRAVEEMMMGWQCEAGHSFRAAGGAGARECWTCQRDAYPVARYTCTVHGDQTVFVRFATDEVGNVRASEIRMTGTEWVPIGDGLICPKCSRKLEYLPPDPLEKGPSNRGGG